MYIYRDNAIPMCTWEILTVLIGLGLRYLKDCLPHMKIPMYWNIWGGCLRIGHMLQWKRL